MAFTVTPTSGEAPYVLSADIDNLINIDGVHYRGFIGSGTAVGSCPAAGFTTLPRVEREEFFESGSVTLTDSVPPGSCRTFTLRIIRVSDEEEIAVSHINVDNV